MSRIRTIKPQFFLNEELAELPALTRLLFIGLWTQADREGRLQDRPKRLKAELFPYDNYDMEKGLTQLADKSLIVRYINEIPLIQIINFSKHQKIDKVNEKPSELPEPREEDYKKTIHRLPIDGEGKGREGKGREGDRPAHRFSNDGFFDKQIETFGGEPEIDKYEKLVEFLHEKLPTGKFRFTNVLSLQNQIGYKEYLELKKCENQRTLREVLESMENKSDLTRKYKDAYLTARNWLKKSFHEIAA